MHPFKAIWGDIWNHIMGRNQTNVINATIPLLRQAIWGNIWKCTVEKRRINATNANMHRFRKVIWWDIWKFTVKKSQTIATNVTMHPFRKAIWGDIWKCTVENSKKMQSLWLCICSERRFEETFENTLWGEIKRMQPMHYWLRPIERGKLVFRNFTSHFIRVQIFQIDFALILSASKYFR